MKDSQLQKLSYRELLALQDRVAAAIASKRMDERIALKEKMQAMAEDAGFRITELFGTARERAPAKSISVKYRHPENKALIWTGRGRRPKWLTAAGGNIERFRVS